MALGQRVDFGDFLVAQGAIEESDLPRLREAAGQSGEVIHIAASKLGLGSEDELATAAAHFFELPFVSSGEFPDEAILPERFTSVFLKNARVLPIVIDEGAITLAVADPFNNVALQAIAFATELKVDLAIACLSDIERSIDDLYDTTLAPGEGQDFLGEQDLVRLRELADEKPVIRFVNRMIEAASESQASDIHVEPTERGLSIRYRVDGKLAAPVIVPAAIQTGLLSRIKIMAELDIGERRLPQDGRVSHSVRGRPLDLRVATIPAIDGESAVIRLLDPESMNFSLSALGFSEEAELAYGQLVDLPHGVTLVTGPTGSGKTTTLYASLAKLKSHETKILTVEDPVEYQLPGVQQIQVHPQIGLTFAAALRSILRHDPDILMVGEIRDVETADIAIQFALTGHPVFSTLHTNGAAAAITRLLDMGVDAYLLTAAINGAVAQRLIRMLCQECAVDDEDARTIVERINPELAATGIFKQAVGCPACRQTGFSGRSAILEVLRMTSLAKAGVLDGASEAQLEEIARKDGMVTLLEDGISKAARGLTPVAEVLRMAKFSE